MIVLFFAYMLINEWYNISTRGDNIATEYLELPLKNGKPLKINYDKFNEVREELESFLENEDYMNNRRFAKKVLFSQEIKSNNTIEGITDDLLIIEKVISDASCINDVKQRKRIINLYNGYKYMFKDFPNEVLRINPIKYEKNNPKIKRLNLNNK